MSASPNLRLPYLDANQNQKSVTHNAALRMLDALVNIEVQSSALRAPPASPGDGQCWIVASGGSGAWLGKDLSVAAWQDGGWAFYPPARGMLAYDDGQATLVLWTGTAWVPLFSLIAQLGVKALGIGTAPDAGNPLSATLNDALFNALGPGAGGSGDVRIKLNKSAAANTASFLFQDGFSGRAEIGLAGDDAFHFKVSADGAAFSDALVLTAGGAASFLRAPIHPPPPAADSSTASATTGWVTAKGYVTAATAAAAAPVQSVAGRTGAVTLSPADVAGVATAAQSLVNALVFG